VDPVPDPLLLRKSGSSGNRTRDLRICSQELWPLDHRGGPVFFTTWLKRKHFFSWHCMFPVFRCFLGFVRSSVTVLRSCCVWHLYCVRRDTVWLPWTVGGHSTRSCNFKTALARLLVNQSNRMTKYNKIICVHFNLFWSSYYRWRRHFSLNEIQSPLPSLENL
jgi:hypothetical protein